MAYYEFSKVYENEESYLDGKKQLIDLPYKLGLRDSKSRFLSESISNSKKLRSRGGNCVHLGNKVILFPYIDDSCLRLEVHLAYDETKVSEPEIINHLENILGGGEKVF